MKFDITPHIVINRSADRKFNFTWCNFYQRLINRLHNYYKLQLLRYEIRSERNTLARLTDHELNDIGLQRHEALAESQRDYTDLPDNRNSPEEKYQRYQN